MDLQGNINDTFKSVMRGLFLEIRVLPDMHRRNTAHAKWLEILQLNFNDGLSEFTTDGRGIILPYNPERWVGTLLLELDRYVKEKQ